MRPGERELIQIVDAALAEAAAKCGAWLVCRPGCWDCCRGPFEISQPDALRLQNGLAELERRDSDRAARLRKRARAALPLAGTDHDEPCPALDPVTGTCELYESRPLTCRLFGPPFRWNGNQPGICELCFEGAGDAEIAACAVELPFDPYDDASTAITVAAALTPPAPNSCSTVS